MALLLDGTNTLATLSGVLKNIVLYAVPGMANG
jgi:hypothetical protein